MMTLSEAINHCLEVIKAQEEKICRLGENDISKITKCECCIREYRQLLDWLTELQSRRIAMGEAV